MIHQKIWCQSLPLLITSFCLIPLCMSEKLIFVMTHFRHGARGSSNIYENDLDLVREKWTKPGELTAIGMRMHYLLGLRNRKRYIDDYKFLSPIYDPHEILVYSTYYNRTLMSAYSQLQGLYPSRQEIGLNLTEKQEKLAIPDVDINDTYIQEEILKMNLSALPNSMTLIPVHMITEKEKILNLYDLDECTALKEQEKQKNYENMESLKSIEIDFNNKFKKYLNEFNGDNSTYGFDWMNSFCGAFYPSYADGRELTDLKNTGIDLEEFNESCYEIQKLYYRDYILGGGKNNFDRMESSKLIREMIRLLKQKVNDDINQETEIKYSDYSKPKMLIISAHDSTIAFNEMFLINCFKLNLDIFKYPRFSTQIAFEVSRKDDNEINNFNELSYKDYTLNYYYNDDKIFSINLDDFIKNVENYLWTDEEVNNYCIGGNNKNDDKDDDKYFTYILIISILSILFVGFLSSTIVLLIINRKLKSGFGHDILMT